MATIRKENKENYGPETNTTMAANTKRVGLSTITGNVPVAVKGKQPLGTSSICNVNVGKKLNEKTKKDNDDTVDCSKENRKNLVNPIVPVAQFEAFKVYEDDGYDERMARIEEKLKGKVKQMGRVQVYKGTAEDRFYTKTEVAELERKKREEEEAEAQKLKQDVVVSPMSLESLDKSNDENVTNENAVPDSEDVLLWGRKSSKDMFFEMEEYRDVIYKYLREHELLHRPKPGYMKKQPDVTSNMRTILVDWLVEVSEEYRLTTETLYLSVNFIDRFLSYMSVVRGKLQLVGTAAMFLASKYEEIYPPAIREFVYITDDTYTKRQVIRMEQLIFKVLGFYLSVPTPLSFITAICSMHKISEKPMYLAMYLSELSLLNGDVYLEFLPSTIASSAIAAARHTLGEKDCWPKEMVETTGYELKHLKQCIEFLMYMFAKAPDMQQRAIQDKYKHQRYLHVSTLRPKDQPITCT